VIAKTASPTAKPRTPGPAARTTPEESLPGTNGSEIPAQLPSAQLLTSTGLTPAATTSTSSSSGAGTGTGTSSRRSTSGPPTARARSPRTVAATGLHPAARQLSSPEGRPGRERLARQVGLAVRGQPAQGLVQGLQGGVAGVVAEDLAGPGDAGRDAAERV